MTSSNGNIFRVTGHLCGEFTGLRWMAWPAQGPVTRSFDIFFDLRLNKRLSKQSWGWWFETLSCSLWRRRNVWWIEAPYVTIKPLWHEKRLFQHIFLNENILISMEKSLKSVHKGPFDNKSALAQVMTWRRTGSRQWTWSNIDTDLWRHMMSLVGRNENTCKFYRKYLGISILFWNALRALQWRHNGHDSVSNHQPDGCLLNCLFRCRSKKTSNSASPAFVRGIHRGPGNSPHKGPVTRKMFPFDDVNMKSSLHSYK